MLPGYPAGVGGNLTSSTDRHEPGPRIQGITSTTIFLSYSTKDHYFAELAGIKLAEAGINLWRDQGQLRAGGDWRSGIERVSLSQSQYS